MALLSLRFDEVGEFCGDIDYDSKACSALHRHRSGFISPWTRLIIADLVVLYNMFPEVRNELPLPSEETLSVWWEAVASESWVPFVERILYFDSECDATPSGKPVAATHVCLECDAAFATVKALAQHCRAKHGRKSVYRTFAPENGICGACGTEFCSRTRLIAHLSDGRRQNCFLWLQQNSVPLCEAEVQRLDQLDRVRRKAARQAGHTQPRSSQPSVSTTGATLGRCSA